jgi:poly-beta-hydroxyalkanoate depolymerase
MGKTNSALGKAVANQLGYTVRMMVTSKTDEKTKTTMKQHTGKFGVYAGKKYLEEVGSVTDAITKINKIVSEKKTN